MAARVLVVDDERDVARLVAYSLGQAGFEVASVSTAAEALLSAGRTRPAVIVLDVGLPDLSGLDVCRRLRADDELAGVGIVMLTAHGGRDDRIAGLEAGADDYVIKPFDVEEVVLRVRALARRLGERDDAQAAAAAARKADRPPLLRSGKLTIDPVTHEVRGDGALLALRPLEYRLLATLMAEPGRVFDRAALLRSVWDIDHGSERIVDVHVRRLRLNLGAFAEQIETVPGFGYRART